MRSMMAPYARTRRIPGSSRMRIKERLADGAAAGEMWFNAEMQRAQRKRRVQCHGGAPWWKGMGNPEECPQEWGHGSLKGYATVVRRRINELRRGFRTGSAEKSTDKLEEAENAEEESGPSFARMHKAEPYATFTATRS